MNALRIAFAALILVVLAGSQNEAKADWFVRVEIKHRFTGQTRFPTLFSSPDKKEAATEYSWFEGLMKNDPFKFKKDVLEPMGYNWMWEPQRMHFVFLSGINPTGR